MKKGPSEAYYLGLPVFCFRYDFFEKYALTKKY